MLRNLVLGGLLAVGLLATAGTASAQYGRGGGYRGGYGGGYGGGGRIYSVPVVAAPRPIVVAPSYGYGFGSPYFAPGFGSPAFVTPGFGYGGFNNGFGGFPGYGNSFGNVNLGYSRPGFGVNLGFIIR